MQKHRMLIYTEHNTPRLRYVLNFIFREGFGSDFRLIGSPEEFRSGEGPKISYSEGNADGPGTAGGDSRSAGKYLEIPFSGLLARRGTGETDPGVVTEGPVPLLFPGESVPGSPGSRSPSRYGFDLFAAVFYMISRYEEYLPFKGDRYGRFPAEESLAGKHGFLEKPVVDLWLEDFRKTLEKRFGGYRPARTEFRFQPTCDVDLPYAFLHRGRLRTMASGLRAVRSDSREEREYRRRVLRGEAKDPFDTFSGIEAIHSRAGLRPKFFFLTAKYGKYDKGISPESPAFRELVGRSMRYADPGIHPSFRASKDPAALRRELKTLEGICGKKLNRSRQHYLRFSLPGSYREYLTAGILGEYSMGFASAAGFRAGTARSFLFYDLLKEEETPLRVFPFQVMDRTLKDYMELDPETALERILSIAGTVRATGGTFSTIWHNDAFSDFGEWIGWKDVYLQMIKALAR